MIPSLSKLRAPRPQATELADRLSLIPSETAPVGAPGDSGEEEEKKRNWSGLIYGVGIPLLIIGGVLVMLLTRNSDNYNDGQIRLPHATRSNLRYGGYAAGTTPSDSRSVRQDIINVQCFGTPTEHSAIHGNHGLGSGFNLFLSESYRSILQGKSVHNDALSLNAVVDHGELVDRKRCPEFDATCLFVSTRKRCAGLNYKKTTYDAEAAAKRLKCQHPFTVMSQLQSIMYEPNDYTSNVIKRMQEMVGYNASLVGIHIRHGDKKTEIPFSPEEIRMLNTKHIAEIARAIVNESRATPSLATPSLQRVIVMSDDRNVAGDISNLLGDDLSVTYFDMAKSDKIECTTNKSCTVYVSADLGAFLYAGFYVMTRARSVMVNSNSNLGVFVDMLTHSQNQFNANAALLDMDLRVTNGVLSEGRFVCKPEWGSRHGLCQSGIPAEKASCKWFPLSYRESPSAADDTIADTKCHTHMEQVCEM